MLQVGIIGFVRTSIVLKIQTLVENMTKFSKNMSLLQKLQGKDPITDCTLIKIKPTWNNINQQLCLAIKNPNGFHYKTEPGIYNITTTYTKPQFIGVKEQNILQPERKRRKTNNQTYQKDRKNGTDPTKKMLLLATNQPILSFNNIRVPHLKTKNLSKICGFSYIKDNSCRYDDKCNKAHIISTAKIVDSQQRKKFSNYVSTKICYRSSDN